MDFLVFIFFVFVLLAIARRMADPAKRAMQLPPEVWDPASIPPEHVLRLGSAPAAALPLFGADAATEESSSELLEDETRYDHDLELAAEDVPIGRDRVLSTDPRPLPAEPVTLEHEVDWEREHEIFHRRFVDARPAAAQTAHGLMDELRDPDAARRAILLGEILGPPVSMRDPRRR